MNTCHEEAPFLYWCAIFLMLDHKISRCTVVSTRIVYTGTYVRYSCPIQVQRTLSTSVLYMYRGTVWVRVYCTVTIVNTVQYGTVWYGTVRYSTVWYSTVQHDPVD